MNTTTTLPVRRLALGAACLLVLMSASVPSAHAQLPGTTITVTLGDFGPEVALPGSTPSVANVTVATSCGAAFDVDLTAAITGNLSGSATLSPTTVSFAGAPTCTPGANEEVTSVLTVDPGTDVLAGGVFEVTVTGTAADAAGGEITDSATGGPTVGPYVDVTFSHNVTMYEVEAGEVATVTIMITSMSNTEVMAMPDFEGVPAGWERPDVVPMNIASPLVDGETGTSAFEFDIMVPPGTEPGETTIMFNVFAHSLGNVVVQSPEEGIPLKVMTMEGQGGGGGGDDSEESPGLAIVPLAMLALALVALRRRTR